MMRIVTAFLCLSLLVPAVAVAEQPARLPSNNELKRFISECESILASGGARPPVETAKRPPRKPDEQGPRPESKLSPQQRETAALALAKELATKPGGMNRKQCQEVLTKLKAYDVPEVMNRLHPLLVVNKTQEERRWVAFEAGKELLPQVFRLDKGTEGDSRRIAFHSPLHRAYRTWMTNSIKQNKSSRAVINDRLKYVEGRLHKLKKSGEKAEVEELIRQLMRSGEEWVISDMLAILSNARGYPNYTLRGAGQVLSYYMGLKIDFKGRRMERQLRRAGSQAQGWLSKCAYCRQVLRSRRR